MIVALGGTESVEKVILLMLFIHKVTGHNNHQRSKRPV